MANGHLDDLRLLDPASAFLQVLGRYEPTEIGQAIVHAVSSSLLDDPMRHRILLQHNEKHRVKQRPTGTIAKHLESIAYMLFRNINLFG